MKNYQVCFHPIAIARNKVRRYFRFSFISYIIFQIYHCITEYKKLPEHSTLIEEEIETKTIDFPKQMTDFWQGIISSGTGIVCYLSARERLFISV